MRFDQIHLYSPDPGDLQDFYTRLLGEEQVSFDTTRLMLRIGSTELVLFTSETPSTYHFAINCALPAIADVLAHVKRITAVIPGPGGEEIIEFPNWKARSVYFQDPAGNIVEIIGREAMHYPYHEGHGRPELFNVSELGLSTHALSILTLKILNNIPVREFWKEGESFVALGDDEGLIIAVDAKEKLWFPSDQPAGVYAWTSRIYAEGNHYQLRYDGQDLFVKEITLPLSSVTQQPGRD